MKKILLSILLLFLSISYVEAQKRPSVTFHIENKSYSQNSLVSLNGDIYKALSQTSDTPPSINWVRASLVSDINTTTSQLTNDGSDGVNPFITSNDIPVYDVFRKSDLTTAANSYTEDIFHQGGLMLNGKVKDASNFNNFGTTLIDNVKISGTTLQTDNIASSLNLTGNTGINFATGNGNGISIFNFNGGSGFVSTTAENHRIATFTKNFTLPSAYARSPNLYGIRIDGNINYSTSTTYNGLGDFTSFYSNIVPNGVGNVYALGGVGKIKLPDYGGSGNQNLSVNDDGEFILTSPVDPVMKLNPTTSTAYIDIFRSEDNYGDGGFGSVDLSVNFTPSTTFGPTGTYAFTQGEQTIASGYGSWSTGYQGTSSGTYSFQHGYQNNSSGYTSSVFGYGNTNSGDYSFVSGANNTNSARYNSTFGVGLINKSTGTLVIGQANEDYSFTGGDFNNPLSPLFIVGNGTLNTGSPNTAGARSTAFQINADANVFINDGNLTLTATEVGASTHTTYIQDNEGNSISTGINSLSNFVIAAGPDLTSERLTISQDGRVSVQNDILFPNNGSRIIFGSDFEEYIVNSTAANAFENYGNGMIYAEATGRHYFTSSEGFGLYGDLYYHKSFIKSDASDSFHTELVNETATQNNVLTYPNKSGTFSTLDDLNSKLNKSGDIMSGTLNMNANAIQLSDYSGDIQGIRDDGGDIEIYSDAFPVRITADGGLIVESGITSQTDAFLQTNVQVGGNVNLVEDSSLVLDSNGDDFSYIRHNSTTGAFQLYASNGFEFRNGDDLAYETINTGRVEANGNITTTGAFRQNSDTRHIFDANEDSFGWIEFDTDNSTFTGTGRKMVYGTESGGHHFINGEDNSYDNVKAGSFSINSMNSAPASSSSIGTVGEIRYTADYIYICVATNTWKRSPLTTW